MSWIHVATALALVVPACASAPTAQESIDPYEVRALAADAYLWGYPLLDNYRVQHAFCIDTESPEYKGPFNELHSEARVFTPDDRTVQTPNSDTPYSMIGFDLRAEPMVVTLPEIEASRYYSAQFIDAYTFNFAYLGTRATGNGGGSWVLAGPSWKGETPDGVKGVIRCETEFASGIFRTQLFSPDDLENVRRIQEGYRVQPLSAFLGRPAPPAAPALEFPVPLSPADQKSSPRVFETLDFLVRHCPPNRQDSKVRYALQRLGIGLEKPFAYDEQNHEIQAAMSQGIADAWVRLATFQKRIASGDVTSGDLFGTREYLGGRWLNRMAGTVLGIYGNSKQEAMYPAYTVDAEGKPLDGSKAYTIRFAADALPPVQAFWSLTMYGLPESLLVENPLRRYLINSPMLDALARDTDGGLTLYVQHDSPGPERESNWLPAPAGPFFCVLRLYLPGPTALDGTWKAPPLVPAD